MGLVGETGCGKSVTAFSVTRLIPDPPGRIMDGTILFKGANLLWGVDREASYKPVKGSNRVKVKRSFRRIKTDLDRMMAVRGGGISMIFQEPMSAMNPIFSVSNQISEALLLHRGVPTIDGLLNATPKGPGVEEALEAIIQAARENRPGQLREACGKLSAAVGLQSIGVQAYHILHNAYPDVDSKVPELRKAIDRLHLSGMQRRYLERERKLYTLQAELRATFLSEMRNAKLEKGKRRAISARRLSTRLRGFYFGLWGLRSRVRRPLNTETFWQSVRLLEGVTIANPVQVARGYPHELSGGMLQRVMIAMALSAEPELLIADEPTTALDVTIQAQILELMRDLKRRVGTAIMLITHDLGVIAEVADRVCVMYAGNIVEIGPVRDIYRTPLHPYTQGLLASIPRMDDPNKKLEAIPGSVPNLIYPPSGCRFHPRCPQAMPVCKEQRPPMTVEATGHVVACHLYHGPVAQG
ncbi:MAG: ATP-binding cassette domain-containing protein [Thermoplasmata archaeon]|nr:ATP-binding cassette domain-containing protein [Thermoplasmata archaeon]